MKINKIKITNFKVFDEYLFDFESADFLMFDGPNGFGKTSFYDAVELLITGEIRRYKSLSAAMIDGRTSFSENPYRYSGVTNGDIEIRGEIEVNGQTLFISRKCKNEEIELSASFKRFRLYNLDSFDSVTNFPIENEESFMTPFFGKNYKHNFEFLNYVEQEENAYLLKNKDKDKRSLIGHLFNVEEFQAEMDRIAEIRKKIAPLFSREQKKMLKDDESRLKDLKDSYSLRSGESTAYNRIFQDIDYFWDAEHINFDNQTYSQLFGEDGVLTNLKALVVNKEDFLKYGFNTRIQKICDDRDLLETFIYFSNFIDDKVQYSKELTLFKAIEGFLKQTSDIENIDISKVDIQIPESINEVINEDLKESYTRKLKELIQIQLKTDDYQKILSTLMLSRDSLIRNFELFLGHEHTYAPEQCPLCGYLWTDEDRMNNENLKHQIQTHALLLKELIKASEDQFYSEFELFIESEFQEVINALSTYIAKDPIDKDYVEKLISIDELLITDLRERFKILGIDVSDFLMKEPTLEKEVFIDAVTEYINSFKKVYPVENVTLGMRKVFREYYLDKLEQFKAIEPDAIEKKIAYVNWQYHLYQNVTIAEQENKNKYKKEQIDKATKLDEQLKDLLNIYKSSIDKYSKDLIKDIEILFHIYSGRIMQDFQGGLGLFISNNSGIRFLTSPSKSFDAMFSMSSGQIAALIISFTLALNKKYSAANKILFIDDPVQTMDELNIAGLVELLRNDFPDRQIFISTHEDKMSTFMRYKFQKFGLRTKRLNMKLFHKQRTQ